MKHGKVDGLVGLWAAALRVLTWWRVRVGCGAQHLAACQQQGGINAGPHAPEIMKARSCNLPCCSDHKLLIHFILGVTRYANIFRVSHTFRFVLRNLEAAHSSSQIWNAHALGAAHSWAML